MELVVRTGPTTFRVYVSAIVQDQAGDSTDSTIGGQPVLSFAFTGSDPWLDATVTLPTTGPQPYFIASSSDIDTGTGVVPDTSGTTV